MDLADIQTPAASEAAIMLGRHGNALLRQQRLPEASAADPAPTGICPGMAELHNNLGLALLRHGHLQAAETEIRLAIRLDPGNPRALYNLAATLVAQGRLREAVSAYDAAIARDPNVPEPHNDLGFVQGALGRAEDAVASLRRAIALRPGYAQAHQNLGHVLAGQQRLAEAAQCYRRAIDLRPGCPVTHNNLGTVLEEQGDLDAAIAQYRTAIAIEPGLAEAHGNLGMALLTVGAMAEGWAEYEWRWQTTEGRALARGFSRPCWNGEPLNGRTLLVHAEQGFGDALQFCRYVPLAAAKSGRIVLEVHRPLFRLMRGLPGVDQLVARGDALPPFDLHIPMLSLPHALKATVVPEAPFYSSRQRDRRPGPPRVGLAWAGDPRPHAPVRAAVDRRRSMAPERLAPLCDIRGVDFVSLQKGGPPAPPWFPLTDPMAQVTDFADTAGLIADLDLVISVDTAVIHLAAAMGKPAWLLNRFDSCWRWGRSGRRSAWYPSLTLYRQPSPGDWDSVLTAVAADMRAVAASGRVSPAG